MGVKLYVQSSDSLLRHIKGNGNQRGPYVCMLAPTPGQPQVHGDGGKFARWSVGNYLITLFATEDVLLHEELVERLQL